MSLLESIMDRYPDDVFLKPEGFDDAVIGVDPKSMRLIYSQTKCIQALIDQGMSNEEAEEFFEYNVAGSGGTGEDGLSYPIFCEDDFYTEQ